ncbi:hypothetical protein SG26_17215 (plasmid) [Haloarcula sp. CBA1115]|uniref:glycosyltransferase family 2 protein n=1 Tax=unclassified Haloarcula TaxID=2624677 RepID=UPI0005955B9E|nr:MULTISPECIES: glycosyltransferase [unclassified Haloarcula]AJF27517.1 hypothetical protein SG26_17215 [Haloarcula sp. CBA1115]
MPELSIIIPTLDPNIEFSWEEKLVDAAVEGEILVCTEGSAAAARNKGIREANGEKLVFLDDDSVPKGEYFDRVSELLDEYPAVTGRIHDTGSPYTRGLSGQYDQGDNGHVTDTVVGCNMAIRRDVLEDVGGFDERLPYGHEEVELIDRVCESYTVWYSPDLLVEHPFAESIPDYLEKQYRHGKESIPYYKIRGENVPRRIMRFILIPTYYLDSTVSKSIISTVGQVVSNIGMLHGYLTYELASSDHLTTAETD